MRLINSVAANSGGSLYSCGGYRQTFYQLNTHSITLLCFLLTLPMDNFSITSQQKMCAHLYFILFCTFSAYVQHTHIDPKTHMKLKVQLPFSSFFSHGEKMPFYLNIANAILHWGEESWLTWGGGWNILGFTGDDLCKQGHSAPFIVVWIRQFIIAMPAGYGATW